MSRHTHCPHCGTDLRGEPLPKIPDVQRPPDMSHYWLAIDVTVREVSDEPLFWACPSCHGCWHAWLIEHPLYDDAELHMPRYTAERQAETSG